MPQEYSSCGHLLMMIGAMNLKQGTEDRKEFSAVANDNAPAETYILETKNINKSFSTVHVLKDINFQLKKGEILGLVGENGAGKSTLIKIIAGHYIADSGEILLDGKPVEIHAPVDSLRLGIRVISQEFNLMNDLTVAENICTGDYPAKSGMISWKEMNQLAREILSQMGEDIEVTKMVGTLTVAQKQIVEIAKAFRRDPNILIMDEPTAALNDQETSHLFDLLRNLRNAGVSIILITHRMQEQFELSDRITVLRDGHLIGTVDTPNTTVAQLISMMVGKELGDTYKGNPSRSFGNVVFEIKDFCVGEKIRNCNLYVRSGEIVSIFGLLGQGQETLSAALISDVKKTSGQLCLNGKTMELRSPVDSCRAGIGYVSDDRKFSGLFPNETTGHNISISALRGLSKNGLIKKKAEDHIVQHWISEMRIRCSSAAQQISSLSGGNQQKAMIARWLSNNSRFLILNMPTRGVDVAAKYDIYKIMENLCDEGVAILMISQEISEILSLSDRIYIMRDGTLVDEFTREQADLDVLMHSAVGEISDAVHG